MPVFSLTLYWRDTARVVLSVRDQKSEGRIKISGN